MLFALSLSISTSASAIECGTVISKNTGDITCEGLFSGNDKVGGETSTWTVNAPSPLFQNLLSGDSSWKYYERINGDDELGLGYSKVEGTVEVTQDFIEAQNSEGPYLVVFKIKLDMLAYM